MCGAHGGLKTAEVHDVRRANRGRGLGGEAGKRLDGVCVCPGPCFRAFCINADQWTTVVRVEGEWRKTVEQVAERSVAKWIAAEKARAEPRHAVVCPNVERLKQAVCSS